MSVLRQLKTWSSWFNTTLYLDIGTSTTRVVYQKKLVWHQPTCLAVESQSGTVVNVGQAAFGILGKAPQAISVVFPVEASQINNLTQMQQYLAGVLQAVTPQLGIPILMNVKAEVTLPISTSPVETQQWRRVVRAAGFQNVVIWSKPQALYQSVVKTKIPQDYQCVIDVGAGTTEIAAFTQGQLVLARTLPFGSQAFTSALETLVRSEYQGTTSWMQMEKIKVQQRSLSFIPDDKNSAHKTSLRVTDLLTRNPKAIYIERTAIEAHFRGVADHLVGLIQDFLAELPSEVASALLERGLYLTGGGSQLAGLGEYLSYQLKVPYVLAEQPTLEVIWGLTELSRLPKTNKAQRK